LSQLRILIVDDHEVSRRGVRSLLTSKTDWVVSEAMNDVEAVEKARIFRPDIVLMDISMPQMNGLEAMRMLGRELPSSKIVIVSQNDAHTTRRQAQELNAAAYLRKSDLSQDLLPTLNRLMGEANSSVPVKPENSKPISAPGNWLADGAAQSETLVNVAPLCAYLVDADFRIQQVHRPARLAAGDVPDSIGRDFNEMIPILWPKQSAGEIVRRFRHTLESGESYIAPERVESRSDRGIHEIHEWQIHRVPLPDGRHGVVCLFAR
jgi:CheY-like chemotaxis protein